MIRETRFLAAWRFLNDWRADLGLPPLALGAFRDFWTWSNRP